MNARPPHGQTQAAGSRGPSNGSKGPWPQGPPRDTERPRMRAGGRASPSRLMPSFAQTASDSSLRNNGCPARTLTARRKENPSRRGRPRTPLRRGSAVPTPGARFAGRVGTRGARRQASGRAADGSRPGPKASVCPAGATDGRTSLSLPPDSCMVGTPVYTYGLLESPGASFTRAFGSPPPRLTSICPFSAASCRGVPPQESRVTGAPISSSRSRTGVWPPRAAKCRAVAPSLSRAVRPMSVKVTWGEGRVADR